MKQFIATVLCAVIPMFTFAADSGYKVNYDGGSIAGIKAGSGLRLYIDSNQVRLVSNKADVIAIPVSSITEVAMDKMFIDA